MTRLRLDDTIAAIATAPGAGAIGIVRLSGPEAEPIARRIFRPSGRAKPRWRTHRLYHGHIVDPATGVAADEVLLAYMAAPRTYTRQDMVEISAHGGPVGLREILRLAVAAGARPAERGEMTLRAFLNGRLDLAQAEAVLDAIQARTPAALATAVAQIGGALSEQVSRVRDRVMGVYAALEATIDFAEDEVPLPEPASMLADLDAAAAALDQLLATARAGQLQREGVRIAIAGRPNAGKSSLLNALLQSDRAIVTDVPGTTRDVIEESIDLGGIPAVLLDTAGLTETSDVVEQIGVARSRTALEQADLALCVFDASRPLRPDDEIAALSRQRAVAGRGVVVALSKSDLPAAISSEEARGVFHSVPVVHVSALYGTGLDALRAELERQAKGNAAEAGGGQVMVTSARHRDALERALAALHDARASVVGGLAPDFTCIDLRIALESVGEITGQSVTEDLLTQIFSRFCIGK
jgi:tRNA modification GTPase